MNMLWIARLVCPRKIAATLCVGLIALLGDYIVVRSTLSENVRAFVDNMTHGAIGLLSWHIVTTHLGDISLSTHVCQVVFCGLVASAVDLDHFAAARSLRIQSPCDLEIFSVVTGCISLLMVVFLIVLVAYLYISLKELKKRVSLNSHLNQHSYSNPAVQPNEELSARGFTMYKAQEDNKAHITPQRDDYPNDINRHSQPPAMNRHAQPPVANRHAQPPANRAPYMPENDQYFGSFSPQPRQGRYAY